MKAVLAAAFAVVASAAALAQGQPSQQQTELLRRLGAEALAVQQAGIVASDKATANSVEILGDQAVRLGAAVMQGLRQAGAPEAGGLAAEDRQAIAQMEPLNGEPFARAFTQTMSRLYPALQRDLQAASDASPAMGDLARSMLPQVQAQLQATQQVAENPAADIQVPNQPSGLPPQRKEVPGTQGR
ncbi:MAG: hypothetical protein ACM31L_08210 [Actinomycetota bacterium]